MYSLRLTQTSEGQDIYRVEIALEGDGLPRQTATTRFDFKLTAQDQEDLRWYLEDFLQYPQDPAPRIAARIEKRISEIGMELFKALFQSSEDARDLWATLWTRLNDTRVEIFTGVKEATAIPWELVRDHKTDTPLALRASAFVRTHPQPAQIPYIPQTDGQIRILLVICRPKGKEDVPFRSVASRLIKGLGADVRDKFKLDVLRPPTFEQLGRVLRAARAGGQPYHVVHFDGHGIYADIEKSAELSVLLAGLSSVFLSGPRSGAHGYLLFENPEQSENMEPVDGSTLGKLLAETNVPVLVLNACRSAHAEPQTAPVSGETEGDDPHSRVRALGSLAQEVMEAGLAGVVAMRYNVYVITAARFVADLYSSLIQGNALGEAATLGRKQLAIKPQRNVGYKQLPLQDWLVPVVYEAMPIPLFPKQSQPATLTITLNVAQATPASGEIDPNLPKQPDAGFFGRDETLYALDRAFDTQSVVLLHAYAGSGKTATAAEFARWYTLTGGIQGPVLFTSFKQYRSLAHVLDQIGQVFENKLEQAGVHWLALNDPERRRSMALQVMNQVPVLWIWDNVEPVSGFPEGTQSVWSQDEQQELVDFLRDARETKAKFLLTSRRDEEKWLGGLPARIRVPPMPTQERVQLARAIAEKHGRRLAEVEDWRPLLELTLGNPLTITVLVGQALRKGLKTKDQIEAFVASLRACEVEFEDEDESEGREKSLGASLSYGFREAFGEEERKQLALLHFFQGFVEVDVLRAMGYPESEWCLPEVRDLTLDEGIALLDRAAEIGLLTSLVGGYYTIHPALPWYFGNLFEQYYSSEGLETKAARAFAEAMGALGYYFHDQYNHGNRDVIAALTFEEANLLYARHLSQVNGWWSCVARTMQGLRSLYGHTGRRAEWARLVTEIVPDYTDPATGGPLPGREEEWSLVTEYRVQLAEESREFEEAERLQQVHLDWDRRRAADALAVPAEKLDGIQHNNIRSLAASLHRLAQIQRELKQEECVAGYEEALELAERIGEHAAAAVCALNLGNAYKNLPAIRDLGNAEQWYRRSLELTDEQDYLGRSKCLGQLGFVAWERFKEARNAGKHAKELLTHINTALEYYSRALDMVPPDAVSDLAGNHNALGVIYTEANKPDRALEHYREAIRYRELEGNLYEAAATRRNVAVILAEAGRFTDALEYANAALCNYETYGDRAKAEDIQETHELIGMIEQDLQGKGA